MSQQALAPGTDSPSTELSITSSSVTSPASGPRPLAVGVGHQGPEAGTVEPRSPLEGGLCHSHKPTPFQATGTCVLCDREEEPCSCFAGTQEKPQVLGHLCCLKP